MKLNSYFSGAGLMDWGLAEAGCEPQQSFEIDPDCCATLRANFKHAVVECDIKDKLVFATRLQVLQGIPQKNPEAIQKMSPTSREIYQARLKYLSNQVQQMKNAQIGRQVGQPVLGQDEPAAQPGMSGMGEG